MQYDFTYYNPTRIHFGKDSLNYLSSELKNYGSNVLLVYGVGSIKKIGLYDKIIAILKECNKNIFECPNITPNPKLKDMMRGVKMIDTHHIDLILAVGGGSVIDCAKGMSVSVGIEDPFKELWLEQKEVTTNNIPVGSILTMVGTGSEFNGGSVITDEDRKIKMGRVFPPHVYPKFSILNPEYTYSVSEYQMCSGAFDVLSHLMEQYFSGEDDNVSDYLIEALMKSLISSLKVAIGDRENYEARSNIMWVASLALNTLVGEGKTQDWEVHNIEHQLGAYTDCAHGMGLAAISVPYYKHIYKYGLKKFVRFAENIFNVDSQGKTDDEIALEGIEALRKFIEDSHMVLHIRELGATEEMLKDIAYSTIEGGEYKKVTHEEIYEILKEAY